MTDGGRLILNGFQRHDQEKTIIGSKKTRSNMDRMICVREKHVELCKGNSNCKRKKYKGTIGNKYVDQIRMNLYEDKYEGTYNKKKCKETRIKE